MRAWDMGHSDHPIFHDVLYIVGKILPDQQVVLKKTPLVEQAVL
jgi:hypothetical protein